MPLIELSTLIAFAIASLVLIVVPGPSVLFVVGRSLAYGWRGGLLSVLGNGLGGVPLVILVAFGVGAIVAHSELLFTIVKLIGAAYLVYLGVQAIRHRNDEVADASLGALQSPWRMVLQGFIVGVTNPKTIVFFVAVLPQFVNYQAGAIELQMLVLGIVFLVLGELSDSVWALAAGGAQAWFARSPGRKVRMQMIGGMLMVGLGVVLALSGAQA